MGAMLPAVAAACERLEEHGMRRSLTNGTKFSYADIAASYKHNMTYIKVRTHRLASCLSAA
jgi:hypothetical protein